MRFAILGDIHANLEALQAVLNDAASEGCSHYACIGDIVGIGQNPHECVEMIRMLGCPTVKGDFDESAYLDDFCEGLNPVARRMTLWTRKQLTQEDKAWLRQLDLVRMIHSFTIVHATLEDPTRWGFVLNEFDAMASFSNQYTDLCFFGHTHIPKFYVKAGSVSIVPGEQMKIVNGAKYFINVGSVGQPRDGDCRACYGIYDLKDSLVRIKRVDYDPGEGQAGMINSGRPPVTAGEQSAGDVKAEDVESAE